MASLPITLDQAMIEQIAREFDLREPNKDGLRALIYELTGNFDPLTPLVMHMATGVGKTYLMAAAIEYLRRQGIRNVMVVTPSLVVQDKTVQNFTNGSGRFVSGFQVDPEVVSPDSYDEWRVSQTRNSLDVATDPSMVFVFNVQQLVAPKKTDTSSTGTLEGQRTKIRKFQEDSGELYEYLTDLDDLIIIADESHLYGATAKAFNQALKDLKPAATVGLTASASKTDNVIYEYPLYRAINDGYVKTPVLVYRESGYKGNEAEERQLRDALSLLRNKEVEYERYVSANPGTRAVKPALFVVCSNVKHATDVAELLRGPGYCGSESAVLQVDNEHNDDATRQLLDTLDRTQSPVRVVVSVDKLKEGWDTKRIAVMCTLRAMASEVLTQQTMGRGLRLPFGRLTGVERVDQLDILAHTSFEDLLNDENILKTFGLEGATEQELSGEELLAQSAESAQQPGPDVPAGVTEPATPQQPVPTGTEKPAAFPTSSGPQVHTMLLDDEEEIQEESLPDPVVVEINPDFAGTTFLFPSSSMEETIKPFELKKIRKEDIEAAAKRITDTGEFLQRKKLVVSDDEQELVAERIDDVKVPSALVGTDAVRKELTRKVSGLRQFTQTQKNIDQLDRRIIPEFMEAADLKAWTDKAKESAIAELERLIKTKVEEHARNTQTETVITPIELPIDQSFTLPLGKEILELLESTQKTEFQVREFYGAWAKGLFPAAAFDSWSGEYLLALLLNYSQDIVWWKRLYRNEGASIAYSTRDNYYPDFVARDVDDVYWIIEGKSDLGADDEIVQKKREAAIDHINELVSEPNFKDTTWGYLIAYETDVRTSDSWADLKAKTQPIKTPRYT